MSDSLIVVTVRIPQSVATRARQLAASQERTVQTVYGRALRLGLDIEEERDTIACTAIKASEFRRRSATTSGQGAGEVGQGE